MMPWTSRRKRRKPPGPAAPRLSPEFRARSEVGPDLFANVPGQNGPAPFSQVCTGGRCATPGCGSRWFTAPKFAPGTGGAAVTWGLAAVAAGALLASDYTRCDDCGTLYLAR